MYEDLRLKAEADNQFVSSQLRDERLHAAQRTDEILRLKRRVVTETATSVDFVFASAASRALSPSCNDEARRHVRYELRDRFEAMAKLELLEFQLGC